MKTIGLFRHAKSDWGDARARDFDRPLNSAAARAPR
jgi:phosphohistidine phosphatase